MRGAELKRGAASAAGANATCEAAPQGGLSAWCASSRVCLALLASPAGAWRRPAWAKTAAPSPARAAPACPAAGATLALATPSPCSSPSGGASCLLPSSPRMHGHMPALACHMPCCLQSGNRSQPAAHLPRTVAPTLRCRCQKPGVSCDTSAPPSWGLSTCPGALPAPAASESSPSPAPASPAQSPDAEPTKPTPSPAPAATPSTPAVPASGNSSSRVDATFAPPGGPWQTAVGLIAEARLLLTLTGAGRVLDWPPCPACPICCRWRARPPPCRRPVLAGPGLADRRLLASVVAILPPDQPYQL